MKLWLACFFLLFFTVEGLQWLGTFDWLAVDQLPLPLMIAGGVSLAIASNRSHHQQPKPDLPKPIESRQTEPKPTDSTYQPPLPSPFVSPPPEGTRSPSKRSISFEIRRRVQKHGEMGRWRRGDAGTRGRGDWER